MARDKILIWNQALSLAGVRNAVQSADEQTREAEHLSAVWEITRDTVLEEAWWNFCTAYQALGELDEDPPATWEYVYALPSDCIAPRYLEGTTRDEEPTPWELGSSEEGIYVLWTDLEDAVVCYTRRIVDPNIWSALFCDGLAYRLAASIAMTEIGTMPDSATMMRSYMAVIAKAKTLSGNTRQRDKQPDAEAIRNR